MSEDDKDLLNQQGKEKKIDTSNVTITNEDIKEEEKLAENKEEEKLVENKEQNTNNNNLSQENKLEILKEEKTKTENSNIVTLTDENFKKEVLESKIPYLVKFSATWCNPCKIIDPYLDEISLEMADKIKIGRMDIEDHPNTPVSYGVRGLPTLIIVKNSEAISMTVGGTTKSNIVKWINETLTVKDETKKDLINQKN